MFYHSLQKQPPTFASNPRQLPAPNPGSRIPWQPSSMPRRPRWNNPYVPPPSPEYLCVYPAWTVWKDYWKFNKPPAILPTPPTTQQEPTSWCHCHVHPTGPPHVATQCHPAPQERYSPTLIPPTPRTPLSTYSKCLATHQPFKNPYYSQFCNAQTPKKCNAGRKKSPSNEKPSPRNLNTKLAHTTNQPPSSFHPLAPCPPNLPPPSPARVSRDSPTPSSIFVPRVSSPAQDPPMNLQFRLPTPLSSESSDSSTTSMDEDEDSFSSSLAAKSVNDKKPGEQMTDKEIDDVSNKKLRSKWGKKTIFSYLFSFPFQKISILDTFDAVSFENLDGIDAKDLVILEPTSTKNSATRERVVSDFFDVVSDEPSLRWLCEPDSRHGRIFYRVLKGPKDMSKRRILDKTLKYYSLRRLRMKDGKPYQSSTFNGFLKKLFADFNYNGIQYSRTMDFNSPGSMAHTLKEFWRQSHVREERTDLGQVKGNRPPLPDNYDQLIYEKAVTDGRMDLTGTKNTRDLLSLIAMKLCTQAGMRGQQVRFYVFFFC